MDETNIDAVQKKSRKKTTVETVKVRGTIAERDINKYQQMISS